MPSVLPNYRTVSANIDVVASRYKKGEREKKKKEKGKKRK
jgi:hypothetical protein